MPLAIHRLQVGLLALLTAIGALAVLALLDHVSADVALRSLRGTPIRGRYEIVADYYMVDLTFLSLAWVERQGGTVRIDLVHRMLPPRVQAASDGRSRWSRR